MSLVLWFAEVLLEPSREYRWSVVLEDWWKRATRPPIQVYAGQAAVLYCILLFLVGERLGNSSFK